LKEISALIPPPTQTPFNPDLRRVFRLSIVSKAVDIEAMHTIEENSKRNMGS
jgi:hypothetical protein